MVYVESFKDLDVYILSRKLSRIIFDLSKEFPREEMYNLSSQIRRAVDSIALNISEGSIGQSNPEFKKFMGYAIRSLAEVVTCLHKASKRKYISEEEFNEHYEYAFNLMNLTAVRQVMMVAFKGKIN